MTFRNFAKLQKRNEEMTKTPDILFQTNDE